jgi:hypothetical protein
MTNYNSLVDKRIELEKQLEVTNTDILTMRGAILLSNEFIEEEEKPEPKPLFPEKEVVVNDLDKEKDGGQKNK